MNPTLNPTPEDDPALRETLKRCSPATYYAACKFRKNGGSDDLRLVVAGVIERFVERELRTKLQGADDTLRLREDLGLDSLTMMEVVMIAEDVLRITVSNEELTHLRTLGDVQQFIAHKISTPRTAIRVSTATEREQWDVARTFEEAGQGEKLHSSPGKNGAGFSAA